MVNRTGGLLPALAGLIALALPAAIPAQTEAGALRWVGTSIPRDAYAADLAKAFHASARIRVLIDDGAETDSIGEVAALTADLAGSFGTSLEVDGRAAGLTVKPVAWDALVVVAHPNNPVDNITLEQLQAVYRGKIDNWRALGGPNQRLALYARLGQPSGVGQSIRKLLLGGSNRTFKASKYFKTSAALQQAIETDPWSLTVTGMASARRHDVKILKLDGTLPNYDTIRSGGYPLYRPVYLITNPKNTRHDLVERFVQFAYSSEGMAVLRRNSVVPYNDALHLVMREIQQSQRFGLE